MLNNFFLKIKNNYKVFVIIFMLNLVILSLVFNKREFENGVYFNYLKSLLMNGDFNIFSQFESQFDKWMVTPTYNHFDYHTPFFSSLLILPYMFFKLFSIISHQEIPFLGQQIFITLMLIVPVIASGKHFLPEGKSLFYKLLVFIAIANGGLWCFLFEPSELSYIQLIFSFIIFIELFSLFEVDNEEPPYVLALAVGQLSILKLDGLFYALVIPVILLISRKTKILKWVIFFIFLSQLQLLIVNYLRFGEWVTRNPIIMNFHHTNYILHCLFGLNGWFIKSPLLLIIVMLMCYQAFFEKMIRDRYIFTTGLLILLTKALLIGTVIVPVADYFSNRVIITETPFFAYSLYLIYFKKYQFRKTLITLFFFFVLFGIYNTYGWLITGDNFDFRFSYFLPFKSILLSQHDITKRAYDYLESLKMNLWPLISLSVISSVFIIINQLFHNMNPRKYRFFFLLSAFTFSIFFSFLNIYNNSRNVDKMKKMGVFNHVVVLRKNAIYYDEVLDMIETGVKSSKLINLPSKQWLESYKTNYIDFVLQNTVSDPINFSNNLRRGIIRQSFWELKN